MVLTDAGLSLRDKALTILAAVSDLKISAAGLRDVVSGTVKIGLNSDTEFLKVGPFRQRLLEGYPEIVPYFVAGMSTQNLKDVRRGVLDAGFYFGRHDFSDLSTLGLADVPMRIVGPTAWQHRLLNGSLEDLIRLPWVYTSEDCPFYSVMAYVFEMTGSKPTTIAWAEDEASMRSLVVSGAGVSIVRADDAAALSQTGKVIEVPMDLPGIPFGFAVAASRQNEPAIAALRGVASELWSITDRQQSPDALGVVS
jgi:DNA-binding transcriptional LysR family regulator